MPVARVITHISPRCQLPMLASCQKMRRMGYSIHLIVAQRKVSGKAKKAHADLGSSGARKQGMNQANTGQIAH